MIRDTIKKVVTGDNLTETEMKNAMLDVLEGKATASQVGSFVTALRMK
jgi:anthranilate phosphoribosyltransferase